MSNNKKIHNKKTHSIRKPSGKKRMKKQHDPMKIVIGILAFVLAINFLVFVVGLSDDASTYVNEYSTLISYFNRQDYPEVYKDVKANEGKEVQTREDTSDLQTLADCYEAILLYHAYNGIGDQENADIWQVKLNELQLQLKDEEFIKAAGEMLSGEQ